MNELASDVLLLFCKHFVCTNHMKPFIATTPISPAMNLCYKNINDQLNKNAADFYISLNNFHEYRSYYSTQSS